LPWRAARTSLAPALLCAGFAAAGAEPAGAPIALEQLGATDAARYRQVFALQEQGQWREADRAIRRLESRLLMGRVLFQRYMHPTRYRSKYKELYDWMKAFADQPGANRIYRLALRRQPSGYKSPPRPSPALSRRIAVAPDPACRPPCKRSAKQRRWVRKIRAGILHQLSHGNPKGAAFGRACRKGGMVDYQSKRHATPAPMSSDARACSGSLAMTSAGSGWSAFFARVESRHLASIRRNGQAMQVPS